MSTEAEQQHAQSHSLTPSRSSRRFSSSDRCARLLQQYVRRLPAARQGDLLPDGHLRSIQDLPPTTVIFMIFGIAEVAATTALCGVVHMIAVAQLLHHER